jgi:hypothetical protein
MQASGDSLSTSSCCSSPSLEQGVLQIDELPLEIILEVFRFLDGASLQVYAAMLLS